MRTNILSSTILAAAALMSAASCEKEIKFKGKQQETSIVLFSTATPGEELSVTVRQSAFILDKNWRDTIRKGLPEAKVKAFIGDSSEPVPLTLSGTDDESAGFTCGYLPKPGDRIRLEAEADGFKNVSAGTTVPEEAKFEIVSVRKGTEYNEEFSDIYMKIRIDDPAEEKNFYRLELSGVYRFATDGHDPEDRPAEESAGGEEFYTAVLPFDSNDPIFNKKGQGSIFGQDTGTKDYFTDSGFDGESYTFEINFHSYDVYNKAISFVVNLQALSKEYYEYTASLDAYNDNDDFAVFSEPVQILCNVNNGIGCFGSVTPGIRTVAAE